MLASYTVTMNDGTEAGIDHLSRRILPGVPDDVRVAEIVMRSIGTTSLSDVKTIVETFEAAGSSNRKELYVSPEEQELREERSRRESIKWDHRAATQRYLDQIDVAAATMRQAADELERITTGLQTLCELPHERAAGRYDRGTLSAEVDPIRFAEQAVDIVTRVAGRAQVHYLVRYAAELHGVATEAAALDS